MKKFRTPLALLLVVVLCISMCACSTITNIVKSTTYNSGDLKDGFSVIKSIQGVEFAVPSNLKDEALGDTEFVEAILGAVDDEEAAKKFAKTTFELKDETTYALVNYSISITMVAPTVLNDDLSSVESAEDFEDIFDWDSEDMTVDIGNSYLKSEINDETKVICPVTCTAKSTDSEETLTYKGYIAAIENANDDVYMLLAVSKDSDDENMKYIAKSLTFTGEALAQVSDEEEETIVTIPTESEDVEDETINDDSNTNTQTPSGNFNEALTAFKFQLNGETITMPMKLSDFMNKFNFVLEKDYKNVTLNKNEYTLVIVEQKDDNAKYLFVNVANVSNQDNVPVEDAMLFCIEADKYDLQGYSNNAKPYFDIILPCNVVVNKTTESEVLAAYGTPDETYTTDESSFTYYTWKLSNREYDYYNFMEITIDKETQLVYGFEYSTMP